MAMRTNGTLTWLVTDHLGSTNVTANANGSLQSEMRYRAFGEIRYTNGITPTDYRYTGQLQQAEAGLYFYNARWYDPQLGRFIQADSIVPRAGNTKAYDRYAYVMNNPINLTDPFGHEGCRRNLGPGHFSEMDCPADAWSFDGNAAPGEVNMYQSSGGQTTSGNNSTQNNTSIYKNAVKPVIDVFTEGVMGIVGAARDNLSIPFSSTNVGDIFYKTPINLANVSVKTLEAVGRSLIGIGWLLEVAPAQAQNYEKYGFPNYSPEAQGHFWGDLTADTIIYGGSFTAGIAGGAGFAWAVGQVFPPAAFGAGITGGVITSQITSTALNQTNIRESWINYFTVTMALPQPPQGAFVNWNPEYLRPY